MSNNQNKPIGTWGSKTWGRKIVAIAWMVSIIETIIGGIGYAWLEHMARDWSNLGSIYLKQKEFEEGFGEYYFTKTGDHTAQINREFFGGTNVLEESGDYKYYIRPYKSGFRAYAVGLSRTMCIDHNNDFKVGAVACQ